MKLFAAVVAFFAAYLIVMAMALSAAVGDGNQSLGGPLQVSGIPGEYLQLYVQAGEQYKVDWAILAAIGKIETDHGRSNAAGVKSGVNFAGCCAGPMQFSVIGHPSTWDSYGNGGSVYDPHAAIPAAARYLVASGAPGDYHRAITVYNHSEIYYRDVMSQADRYRAMAVAPTQGQEQSGPIDGEWLVPLPGFPGEQCDARIIRNVVAIAERFHAIVTDCYAASGHEATGEHPLGLAVDLVPRPPSSWEQMAELARYAGWRPSCASTGCAGQTGTAFRFVGYNNYPGHGDPEHAGGNAHLHLSWNHGPGRPAEWVDLLAE